MVVEGFAEGGQGAEILRAGRGGQHGNGQGSLLMREDIRQGQVAISLGGAAFAFGEHPAEASVGGAASHGCVRMHNADVERLFELVTEGTTVVIQ